MRKKKYKLVCIVCGLDFTTKPSDAHRRKTCSRRCAHQTPAFKNYSMSRRNRIIKECPQCKQAFAVKRSMAPRRTHCSQACMADAYKTRMLGKGNPRYKDGLADTLQYRRRASVKWRARNKQKTSYYNRWTKMIRRGVEGKHSPSDLELILTRQKNRCVYCRTRLSPRTRHLDHIIPVARGGTNWPKNLQYLCVSCNLKKHTTAPAVFARKMGFLL